ncbi:condensation domain-containing protein [Streptomyces thinghirensis]|nr:condensation domain-containing protein [Streptomyces thinghirensis]
MLAFHERLQDSTRAGGADRRALSEGQKGLWLLHKLRPGLTRAATSPSLPHVGAVRHRGLRGLPAGDVPARAATQRGRRGRGAPLPGATSRRRRCVLRHRTVPQGCPTTSCSPSRASEAKAPFDLYQEGPARAVVVHGGLRADTPQTLVLLVLHHLVFDGASTPVLLRDLLHLRRPAQGRHPQPASARPDATTRSCAGRADFLAGPEGARHRAYWQDTWRATCPCCASASSAHTRHARGGRGRRPALPRPSPPGCATCARPPASGRGALPRRVRTAPAPLRRRARPRRRRAVPGQARRHLRRRRRLAP